LASSRRRSSRQVVSTARPRASLALTALLSTLTSPPDAKLSTRRHCCSAPYGPLRSKNETVALTMRFSNRRSPFWSRCSTYWRKSSFTRPLDVTISRFMARVLSTLVLARVNKQTGRASGKAWAARPLPLRPPQRRGYLPEGRRPCASRFDCRLWLNHLCSVNVRMTPSCHRTIPLMPSRLRGAARRILAFSLLDITYHGIRRQQERRN
jgi:hypothetical protein